MKSKLNKNSSQLDYEVEADKMYRGSRRIYNKTIEIQYKIVEQLFGNDIQRMNVKRDLGIIASALASFTLLAIKSGLVKTFVPLVIGIILLIVLIIYIFWDLSLEVKDNHSRYRRFYNEYEKYSNEWKTCLEAITKFKKEPTPENLKQAYDLYDARLQETLTIQDKSKENLKEKESKLSSDCKLIIMMIFFTSALVCIVCSFLIKS